MTQKLNDKEKNAFDLLFEKAKNWAEQNSATLGGIEIALGVAAITYGINTGAIKMGYDLVTTLIGNDSNINNIIGGVAGASIGCIAGACVGGIGIAGLGSAIAIPTAILSGGSALILGSMGYTSVDLISKLIGSTTVDFSALALGGSLLFVGIALILDGARRILPESLKEKFKDIMSSFKDYIISFAKNICVTIAKTYEEFNKACQKVQKDLFRIMQNRGIQGITAATIIGSSTLGGITVGSGIAASSVTVLGSSTLGGWALGLGLVSAPIWPVILTGAGSVAVGVGVFSVIKNALCKDDDILNDMKIIFPENNK